MKFNLFGAPGERHSSGHEEELDDPEKRRTLKRLAAVAVASSVSGTSLEADTTPKGLFDERFKAAEQLEKNGITDFQRLVYKPGISEALGQGLIPLNYDDKPDIREVRRVFTALKDGLFINQEEQEKRFVTEALHGFKPDKNYRSYLERVAHNCIDVWRMYLGLPQLHETFGVSEYKPANSTEDRYYYKLNTFLSEQAMQFFPPEKVAQFPEMYEPSIIYKLWYDIGKIGGINHSSVPEKNRGVKIHVENEPTLVLGRYILSKGEDEEGTYISYYDRWDLDESLEGKKGIIGKPFEIYDRIYYDPKTFEVIRPLVIVGRRPPSEDRPRHKSE